MKTNTKNKFFLQILGANYICKLIILFIVTTILTSTAHFYFGNQNAVIFILIFMFLLSNLYSFLHFKTNRHIDDIGQNNAQDPKFLQLIESLPAIAVQGYNKSRQVIYWNHASEKIYGYSKDEAISRKIEDLIIPSELKKYVVQSHINWLTQGIPIPSSELLLTNRDGNLVPVYSSHVMLNEQTENPEIFCIDVDLTQQYQAASELKKAWLTDTLTELPNRLYVSEVLKDTIYNQVEEQLLAVIFIDIDRFKEINNSLGHNEGDELLKMVAKRLKQNTSFGDVLCRSGGDEFVLIITNIKNRLFLDKKASDILNCFQQGFNLYNKDIHVTTSMGISVYPEDSTNHHELLKKADNAMYHAKELGGNQMTYYDPSLDAEIQRKMLISSSLRQALVENELYLVYQPQLALTKRSPKVISCEALVRWWSKDQKKLVPPSIFIPIAEHSDLIIELGYWVLDSACDQLSKWKRQGIKNFRVDINLSGKQLKSRGFFSILTNTLRRYNLKPKEIGIELTENIFINADFKLLKQLKRLKQSGMKISIDDFGTGYSSLNYLMSFPLTHLKIDKSFIKDILSNRKNLAIVDAIINLGHKLDLHIVVEGVETKKQNDTCFYLGADLAQGYYYHKPMSAPELFQLLSTK